MSSTPVTMATALEMQTAAGYKVLDGNLIWDYEPSTLRCDDVVQTAGVQTAGVQTTFLNDSESEDESKDDEVFYEILDMAIKISSELFNSGVEHFLFGRSIYITIV